MLCSTIKSEGKEEDGGMLLVMAFIFPKNHYAHGDLAFQEVA